MLLECKTVLDPGAVAQQDQRLARLGTEIGRKLRTTVLLHSLRDLPPNLPATRIREKIEARVREAAAAEVQELDIRDVHQGVPYALRALVLSSSSGQDLPAGVHAVMSDAQTITIPVQLRAALVEKAGKYGQLELPFLIALSAGTNHPATTQHELEALFGDRVWDVLRATELPAPKLNGLFTLHREGVHRYSRVSAVLVYRFKWLGDGREHHIHVYHNPFAEKPIDLGLFLGVPQFMRQGEATTIGWVDGEPEPS